MHSSLFIASVSLLVLGGAIVAEAAQPAPAIPASPATDLPPSLVEGGWIGDLGVGSDSPLRIVLRLRKSPAGSVTGEMDSPDQGVIGLPVDEVSVKDGEILVQVKAVGGAFRGKVSAEGNECHGFWTQGLPLPVTLRHVSLAPQNTRPWAPALLAQETEAWEADLTAGAARVESNWKLPLLAARQDDWLETPLPPALRLRLGNLGARLESLTSELAEGKRSAAHRLASSLLQAAGRTREAMNAVRAELRSPGSHEAATYLAEELESGRGGGRRDGKKPDEIEVAARRFRARNRIPGLALAVVKDGKVVRSAAYGLANVELRVPATPETVFELGSITKQFTATGIMMLVEEGKLGLDDKIRDRLPNLPEAWNGITLRHLLTHTSGIKNYTSLPTFATAMSREYTLAEIIGLVEKLPLDFQPGEKWAYCNTGYYLLGMVLERMSGKPYAEFLAERIFRPLGMTATRVNSFTAVLPNRATGYSWAGDRTSNAVLWPISGRGGAGSLVSTVPDLAKWDAALYDEKLLKRTSLEAMWKPVRLNDGSTAPYGFGWGVSDYRGHRLVAHSGGLPGWSADIARFPDDHLTVIVLTNRDSVGPGILGLQVADLSLPPGEEPAEDADAKRVVRTAVRALAAGKNPLGGLADLADGPASGTATDTAAFLREQGTLRFLQVIAKRTDETGLRRFRFRAQFARGTWTLAAVLHPKEDRLAWLALQPE